MILRYLILFGGIVLMITGCNSLVSQQFGTHRLRTIDVEEATTTGLGDADFVEIGGAVVGAPFIVGPALRGTDKDYVLRPVFTAEQQSAWASGQTVTVNLVGWTETTDPACTTAPGCPPEAGRAVRGLLSAPTFQKNPLGNWSAQRIVLASETTYLQLYQKPMAWYWNLALLLGGLLLAVLPEARRHKKRLAEQDAAPTN
jgi:hypothetical protein